MAKLPYLRDSTPPPKIGKGDLIAAKIQSFEIVKSNYKNSDGSDKLQVKFLLEYQGYTFPAWMGYYRLPFRVSKIAKLNEVFVDATKVMTSDIDDFLRKLAAYGWIYVECTGERTWEDQTYPKFTVVATKLPPRQATLQEQPSPGPFKRGTLKQPMQRVRFRKFYGGYLIDEEADVPQAVADGLIENGTAIPIDPVASDLTPADV